MLAARTAARAFYTAAAGGKRSRALKRAAKVQSLSKGETGKLRTSKLHRTFRGHSGSVRPEYLKALRREATR